MADAVGALRALCDIGMPETGIEQTADLATANPYWNPRAVERNEIYRLLGRHGRASHHAQTEVETG